MRAFWLLLGIGSLILGAVGVVLPLLPTVPFLLLAAYSFARSSDRLHGWLVSHNIFGPPIADWRSGGIIRRRAKIFASASILATFAISIGLGASFFVLGVQTVVLFMVSVFIWSRPEH